MRFQHCAFSSALFSAIVGAGLMAPVFADEMTAEQYYERGYQEMPSNYPKAIEDFTVAIQKNPEYWKAYANRGAARYHTQDYGSALKDFNTAIPHLPPVPNIIELKRLTEEAISNGNRAPEKVVVRQPVYANRSNINVPVTGADNIANLSNLLMQHGYKIPNNLIHPMGADQHLIHPMGGQTDSAQAAQVSFDHGCEKAKSMDFAGAIKDFDECIKLNPKHGLAYANRGAARQQTGDTRGALDDLNKAVELLPDNEGVKQTRDRMLKAG